MVLDICKTDSANVVVKIKVSPSFIRDEKGKVAKEIASSVDIRGFRKGRVPIGFVKTRLKDRVHESMKSNILADGVKKALKELKIEESSLVSSPEVFDFKEDDNGISLDVKLFLRPSFDIVDYKKFIPIYDEPTVSKKEIDDALNNLVSSASPLVKAQNKRVFKDGDYADITLKAYVDENQVEELSSPSKIIQANKESVLEGFTSKLIGTKINEPKEIEMIIPSNYKNKKLVSKKVTFKLTINKFLKSNPPKTITSATLKKLFPQNKDITVYKLKKDIEDNIRSEKLRDLYLNKLKKEFLDKVMKNINFDIPDIIVDREVNIAIRQEVKAMSQDKKIPIQKDRDIFKKLREKHLKESQERVKLTFIIDKLAQKEGVSVSDDELAEYIYYDAIRAKKNPKEYLKMCSDSGLATVIRMSMVENRLFLKLFSDKNIQNNKDKA